MNQFELAELNWGYTYELLIAGIIHSIAEIITFLILSAFATIHCIVCLPECIKELRKKYRLTESRE